MGPGGVCEVVGDLLCVQVATCDTVLRFEMEAGYGEINEDAVAEGEEGGGMGRSDRKFVGVRQ